MSEQNTEVEELKAGIEALEKQNRTLLGELKAAKAKAKGAEIDPEEHAKLQSELDDLKASSAKAEKAAAKTIEELQGKLGSKDKALQSHLIDSGLTEALLQENVKPELMPAVKAMLRQKANLKEDGENYQALIEDKPLAEAVKEWAAGDEGKAFVLAADSSGGGATGGDKPAGGGADTKGNLAGDKAERTAALRARFPELNN